jgi:hypothetical protein
VAAHSTVRALFGSYSGKLYQVKRASDGTTKDVGALAAGGLAAAATQDAFCSGTMCVITIVYDQSGHGSDLAYQGPGGAGGQDTAASATGESVTAGPMHKQGAIVLGSGGDCCATNTNLSEGTFYEGALVTGYPSDATDNAVQTNIIAAGYRP